MPEFFFHVGIDLHRPPAAGAGGAAAAGDHIRRRFGDVARVVEDDDDEQREQASSATQQAAAQPADAPASRQGSPRGSRPEDDCRAGALVLRSVDMGAGALAADATRGAWEPADSGDEELGWGVIRLYRERDEAPGLEPPGAASGGGGAHDGAVARASPARKAPATTAAPAEADDSDCATVCVLAVPSYMTPSDFLGFVGEATRAAVSHFRMLRTQRINRYMVLMRFRSGRRARAWRREWNGRPFNDIESENCHVVFVRSIKFRAPSPRAGHAAQSFPRTLHDPFAPKPLPPAAPGDAAPAGGALRTRPMAPPTPALKELPTCPVCLERMDESTGLLTILCRHVFHCSCLQKWRGSGCPVCRFTQDGLPAAAAAADPLAEKAVARECAACASDVNLWVCLICGNVGCGRYDGAHAFAHHSATTHPFAMDLATQRVWDYAEDGYVHRILQSKSDGKLLELPSIPAARQADAMGLGEPAAAAKLDALSLEYSHLLASQLDSQRLYFEEKLERAADKASRAADDARAARADLDRARQELQAQAAEAERLRADELPRLERECDRATARADRFSDLTRVMQREWRDERAVAEGLKTRADYLDGEVARLGAECADLREQNRDLSFFISGQQKLQDLDMDDDLADATVEVAEEKKPKKRGKKR